MNITTKQLTVGGTAEFVQMLRLFENVFEMQDFQMPDEDYLTLLLARKDLIVFIAQYEGIIVGALTAHVLPSYYFESSEVYIYDLAVETTFQRKGIGKKLLLALTEYCSLHGYKEFFVQADEPDTHALEFYRSTGGTAEKVVHFYYRVNS
jgi:aminoglycoside 3-N-acetyltransferase I